MLPDSIADQLGNQIQAAIGDIASGAPTSLKPILNLVFALSNAPSLI